MKKTAKKTKRRWKQLAPFLFLGLGSVGILMLVLNSQGLQNRARLKSSRQRSRLKKKFSTLGRLALWLDAHMSWLSVIASIALHLTIFVIMHGQPQQPTVLSLQSPKVSRIRILANPHGNRRLVAKTFEVKAQQTPTLPKPKPIPNRVQPKPPTTVAPATTTTRVQNQAQESSPAPKEAPQSFGDSKTIGVVGKGSSNTKDRSEVGASTEWLPIVQEKPRMPMEARKKGLEGFVTFSFDIKEDGGIENLRFVSAKNRSVFEDEARRAIKKLRYLPRKIKGRPVRVVGHTYTVVFRLTH